MSEREWSLATDASRNVNTNAELRNVANALFEGSGGIEEDRDRAIELWKEAAEKGDLRSKYSLAIQYMSNPETIDRVKARDLLESALMSKDEEEEEEDKEIEGLITFALGTLEEAEKGDEHETAMELYLRSAKRGHSGACFKIGQNFQKNQDFENARQWFVNGAALGHADCHHSLSTMYVNGEGGTQDFQKGFQLALRAVHLSEDHSDPLPHAEFTLGNHYYHGVGTKQNRTEAIKFWKRSAEKGFVFAQINLGTAYRDDHALSEARKYYAMASENSEIAAKMLKELDEKYPHLYSSSSS